MRSQNEWPAKLTRPNISGLFPRMRLFERLDKHRSQPIIWVNGPPGSGKTCLVTSYLEAQAHHGFWYRVDLRDSDPATFFHYTSLAAAHVSAQEKNPLPALTPEYFLNLPAFSQRYFEEFYDRLPKPFVLVLDDYQEISPESLLHGVVRDGIPLIPSGSSVVIISRRTPPPALSRLLVNNVMEVVGWEDLRLSAEEFHGIIHMLSDRSLSEEEIRVLYERTEGWVAGLVLLLKHTKADILKPLSSAPQPGDTLFNYFAGEIFERVDPKMQNFVMKTAFLPYVTPRMGEELTGIYNAGWILSEMSRQYYFTSRQEAQEPIYQYHALFREFLISQAREFFSPEETAKIRHQAAALLQTLGQPEDAVELFLGNGDWPEAVNLILLQAIPLIHQGRFQTLEGWIAKLPQPLVQQTPYLLYLLGVCRLLFKPGEAREHLEKAFHLFGQSKDLNGAFLAWSGFVDSLLFDPGDMRRLDPWIDWLNVHLEESSSFSSPEIEARVVASVVGIMAWRKPELPGGENWIKRAMAVLESSGDTNLRIMMGVNLALYHVWKGDLPSTWMVIECFKKLAESPAATPYTRIMYLLIESEYHWLTVNPEESLRLTDKGLEIIEASGFHIWDHFFYIQGAHGALTAGNLPLAWDFIQKMRSVLEGINRFDISNYHYINAWYYLCQGDMTRALQHAQTAVDMAQESGVSIHEALCRLGLALIQFELRRDREATQNLSQVFSIIKKAGGSGIECMYWLLKAHFQLERGKETAGVKTLRKAMEMWRKMDTVHTPFWRPSLMATMCLKALEEGIEVDYVRSLIRKRELVPETPPLDCENWPYDIRIRTLGQFEILKEDRSLRVSGKAQHKPLEMLKALIAFGGHEVRQDRLIDALWSEAEGDMAQGSFEVTLHRLRKLLGNDNTVILKEGKLNLNTLYCWADVWAVETLMEKIDAFLKANKNPGLDKRIEALHEKILSIYRGTFLKQDQNSPWAFSLQEKLHSRFLRQFGWLGRQYELTGSWTKAVNLYLKILEIDDQDEEFYRRLMTCYQKLGQQSEAMAVYKRCHKILSTVLGIEPSPEIKSLFQTLRNQK
ncbi:MAG: hypothetical protein HY730_10215 [Candidatus Tectomicrobia bacterium]|uniref:Bacterial transcriptional activator domain-containing protein n=1 Tax=Tectimicrobiota bacterium TaxID=2528274 RepID=A0A933LR10_UNCTE|nr:hypothetical protein [Candidatus Tectomicrobia bacterium]